MPQRKQLISIEKITDCSTGDYRVGELDFGIHCGELESYLNSYGYEGKKELLAMLGHLCWHVEKYFQDIVSKEHAGQQKSCT